MQKKFERFKEIRVIGAGAFGKTVLVEDLMQNGKRVVIKVPLTEETESSLINDLINNAVLQNSLKEMAHANIVNYEGFDKHEGRFVMILEYVKGRDLRKLVGPHVAEPAADGSEPGAAHYGGRLHGPGGGAPCARVP